jgi:hypothetical protein
MRTLVTPNSCSVEAAAVYQQVSGQWLGCDWPTAFGVTGLNLNGLRSSQAWLMAQATAGVEAADWRAAAAWLARVEETAVQAESCARTAASLCEAGRFSDALRLAREACALESRYHSEPGWQALVQVIASAIQDAAKS